MGVIEYGRLIQMTEDYAFAVGKAVREGKGLVQYTAGENDALYKVGCQWMDSWSIEAIILDVEYTGIYTGEAAAKEKL